MFQDTLALKTNPFGPSFPASQENLERLAFLTDLDRQPLRLDECGELLRPLFCTQILGLETHQARFHELMTERGYVLDGEGARAVDSALVLIRGAIGSGKTTLGSWMIAELARLPGNPLACVYVPEPAEDSDAARIASLNLLRERIAAVPRGHHVAALVENVTSASMNAAIACFKELVSWPRLFVLTTSNLKLLDADAKTLGGTARIEAFTLRQITAADADAYVAHRVPQFRDPKRQELDALSPTFPLPQGFAGRVVQKTANDGEVPVVLRQLNTHFRGQLVRHASRLRSRTGHVPLPQATAETLIDYMMPEA